MNPVVTIGVCVKNGEHSIKEVIESILNQDFPHELLELIFVDDGSEDRTLSILLDYVRRMDIPSRVYHHPWKGLGVTRNVVVNNARGKYIIWVDADTIISKDYVTKQVQFLDQDPLVGIAYGKSVIKFTGNLVSDLFASLLFAEELKYGGRTTQKMRGIAGAIYRTEAIRGVGGFDNYIKGAGEDIDIAHRIAKTGYKIFFSTGAEFNLNKIINGWINLWYKHYWYGCGMHYLHHKYMHDHLEAISLCKKIPPIDFLLGLLYSINTYKILQKKIIFLLPLYLAFARIAWLFGFSKAHITKYCR